NGVSDGSSSSPWSSAWISWLTLLVAGLSLYKLWRQDPRALSGFIQLLGAWWLQALLAIPLFPSSAPMLSGLFQGVLGAWSLLIRGLLLLTTALVIRSHAPDLFATSPDLKSRLTRARHRFAGLLTFILISATIGAFLVNRTQLQRCLQDGTRDTLLIAGYTQQLIEQTQAGATLLSTSPALQALFDDHASDQLKLTNVALDRYKRTYRDSLVYVMNASGTVLASSNRAERNSLVGRNFEFRPYFFEAMKGTETLYFALGKITMERGLYCSAPVFNASNTVILGVATIKISLNHLDHRFTMAAPTFLVDEKGIVLSGNRPELFLRPLWPQTADQLNSYVNSNQYGDLNGTPILEQAPTIGRELAFDGNRALYVSTVLPGSTWSLVQLTPT
ncbi:MAG TPA: cache domain-containing protein, partial [Candidatus Ozemobacteraceae bacterium]|nr:cache domain-containing protein [Candidatus Ozemobacteraceae bacterium]